jgi:hypothetical protein
MTSITNNTIDSLQRRKSELKPSIKDMTFLWWIYEHSKEEDDSQATFKKNMETQPKDWKYLNQPVFYKLNKWWFRCKDFSSYDWDNSILIVGETNLFGVGLDESDTFAAQLEAKIGVPCINLSGVGYSNAMIAENLSLILNDVKPRAVVVGWSPFDRWAYVHHLSNAWIIQYKNATPANYAPLYTNNFKNDLFNLTIQTKSLECITNTKSLLQNKNIPVCHLCFFDIMATEGIDQSLVSDIYYASNVDVSRNLITAGTGTIANYVNHVYDNILSSIT